MNFKTVSMKTVTLPLVEIFALASTRGMLGAGLALLLGEKLSRADRRLLGMILTTIGVLTTPHSPRISSGVANCLKCDEDAKMDR